jgi:hypothetical protein
MTGPRTRSPLRLSDAGDAKRAWITLLTTEHYNLQTLSPDTTKHKRPGQGNIVSVRNW